MFSVCHYLFSGTKRQRLIKTAINHTLYNMSVKKELPATFFLLLAVFLEYSIQYSCVNRKSLNILTYFKFVYIIIIEWYNVIKKIVHQLLIK